MRTLRLPLFALAVSLLTPAPSALATGLGLYFEYGNVFDGQLDHTIAGDVDFDEDHFGGGFAFDTNVANDRLFNYRLDVGYQHVDGDYGPFGDLDGDGLVLHNAFGFGVFRNDRVRVWLGPAVRLSFDFFDEVPVFDNVFKLGVGLGPEVGINLHTGDLVSLGLTAGYQFRYVLAVPDDSAFSNEDGYEHMAFIKMHLLFRLSGDSFVEERPPYRSGTAPARPETVVVEDTNAAPPARPTKVAPSSAPSKAVAETRPRTSPTRQSEADAYNMEIWNQQQRHSK